MEFELVEQEEMLEGLLTLTGGISWFILCTFKQGV